MLFFKLNFKLKALFLFICFPFFCFSQNTLDVNLEGTILDEFENHIPYASIGIIAKQIGTASNDDGQFYLKVSKSNLNDSLEVSSIGFKTLKITVQDYINQETKTLVLIEDIVSLDEIIIESPDGYVKNAFKNLKKNHLSSKHQLNILYRRSSVEHGKTRFLIENYMKLIDYGPASVFWNAAEISESRQSVDYRFAFRKQPGHAISVSARINPLRLGVSIKKFDWKKIGDTSYNGEDLVIIEGREKKNESNFIRFYIGIDTYGVYKIELDRLDALFIYKKDRDGKLILSYHNRVAEFPIAIKPHVQKLLKLQKPKINGSYRHEIIVLSIEADKDKIDVKNSILKSRIDIGDFNVKYNPIFWDTIAIPPKTKFYKQSIKDLESIYEVPIETQFQFVQKIKQ